MGISDYLRGVREKVGHAPLMVPSVAAIIMNERGEVLLHRASDDGMWRTIGGAIDPHEEPAAAAVREAREETGLTVRVERLAAVYAGPDMHYPNGDVCWCVSMVFVCRPMGGETAATSEESLELRYFGAGELPRLTRWDQQAVEAAVAGRAEAWFVR